ncbi:hypothetical protein [Actinoplanes sp. NPDC049316]|uniref:hypothetical protein n=1 Tax=Actinoplanes sp. NPDC049316 TaxID=3154727 RepID=UPI003414FD65
MVVGAVVTGGRVAGGVVARVGGGVTGRVAGEVVGAAVVGAAVGAVLAEVVGRGQCRPRAWWSALVAEPSSGAAWRTACGRWTVWADARGDSFRNL